MAWWEVVDTNGWPQQLWEQRGKREKWWVSDPSNQLWLRKSPRRSRPNEPAVEAFTLELARRCGFDVAHGRASIWTNSAGEVVRGFVSRKFGELNEEQRTGAELVAGFDRDSSDARINATLEKAYAALDLAKVAADDELREPFVRMLIFDAWIGNSDRHLGNWALLVSDRARFAPMFDTAGCLGAELLDDHPLLTANATEALVSQYAHGCKSGFGDGLRRPGILQDEVIATARTWPEWRTAYEALASRFFEAMGSEVALLLEEIPSDWWSEPRRMFALRLLSVRAKIIGGAAP